MGEGQEIGPEDIAESSLPPEVEVLAVPLPLKALMPWHRPRKQYVREQQWALNVERLLGRLNAGSDAGPKDIKYLTLPGIDYLDVRMISDVCAKVGCTLTSTSFLAAPEGNPARARAQFREESLKQAGRVTDNSITFPSRLEEVATHTSQAHIDVRRRAPFDIINVDACGSIAPADATHSTRLLDALHRLLELQFNTNKSRWLLFLTTDARPDTLSAALKQAFKTAIIQNAEHGEEFRATAREFLEIKADVDIGTGIDAAATNANLFLKFYSLGISKWMLGNSNFRGWELKAMDGFFYSTTPKNDPRPTMASLAFEFIPRPVGLVDQFGAVNAVPIVYVPSEDYSLRAIKKAVAMQDLDARMVAEPDLRSALGARTKLLLEEAGYAGETLLAYDELIET